MKKQSFDQGWEFSEISGLMALFNPAPWQPVTLPHDAMIGKPRSASNPISEEMYIGNHRKAYRGHMLAVVRSTGQQDKITLIARIESLPPAQVKLQAI